ncbi:H-NS histone family protein [Cupriavidus sp. TKC]|uniref:H-NS histone family protein n=1 Tax=Cupriavidus sp. TKC TaxID=2880159 RepID=UPI00398C14FE
MEKYGLSVSDLPPVPVSGRRTPVEAKASPVLYRDPETGKTWSGRGRTPSWLGRDRGRYRVPQPPSEPRGG